MTFEHISAPLGRVIEQAARLWRDQHGTDEIAAKLGVDEHEIYNRLDEIKRHDAPKVSEVSATRTPAKRYIR